MSKQRRRWEGGEAPGEKQWQLWRRAGIPLSLSEGEGEGESESCVTLILFSFYLGICVSHVWNKNYQFLNLPIYSIPNASGNQALV